MDIVKHHQSPKILKNQKFRVLNLPKLMTESVCLMRLPSRTRPFLAKFKDGCNHNFLQKLTFKNISLNLMLGILTKLFEDTSPLLWEALDCGILGLCLKMAPVAGRQHQVCEVHSSQLGSCFGRQLFQVSKITALGVSIIKQTFNSQECGYLGYDINQQIIFPQILGDRNSSNLHRLL